MGYFKWLLMMVGANRSHYTKLYHYLSIVDWQPDPHTMLDRDRVADGVALRHLYARAMKKSQPTGDDDKASVLEVLVALAMRIDEIMGEPEENHAEVWFNVMIKNLGLSRFSDDRYDEDKVRYIVDRWISKKYAANGTGGLFPLSHPMRDQRDIPIWDQASDFIMENY